MTRLTAALAAMTLMALGSAAFAQDIEKGEKIFRKCAACHSVEDDGAKRAGPNLRTVVGRTVGSLEGFAYSVALKDAAAAGDVWSEEHLSEFLANPKALYKGHKMSFAGLKKEEERVDVIAYLKSLSPQTEEASPEAEATAADPETAAQ